jgi:hypothetical protein
MAYVATENWRKLLVDFRQRDRYMLGQTGTKRERFLVEIKGRVGDSMLKKAAGERWCRALTNDGRFGTWTCALVEAN